MRCPFCQARDSRVVDSRELGSGESIRRRRECAACGRRFTTYERVESGGLMVVKRDGRREEFDARKLRDKLRIALTKRPVAQGEIDRIITTVETELLAMGTVEVPSTAIGEIVLRELKQVDEVAYIRFASVYRSFADLQDLRREMDVLSGTLDKPERSG
ncbi:transcriptional regulator NrdR [Nitrolancea hollandica]|uniref:Transcriptional repressor NrdR n=1 Tax=Nitrolancea hollandica Lb TaxID=1129897 RepID=I4EH42_9BACT|nr:transcriptional regulator NrdR [Nitrolancea hollandica]CCF84004.1 Transcriptional repressor nrdR [Nitrolancea hollandica Lb]